MKSIDPDKRNAVKTSDSWMQENFDSKQPKHYEIHRLAFFYSIFDVGRLPRKGA
jgi:hypothetical protein